MRRRLRSLGLALVLVAPLGATARALETPWEEVEAAARELLGGALEEEEVRRLLRSRTVREALAELLRGWDGRDDRAEVTRGDGGLTLRVVLGRRETRCLRAEETPERAGEPPDCREEVRVVADRQLDLHADLWRAPPPTRRRAPDAAPDGPSGGPPPSVLRRPAEAEAAPSPALGALLAEHEAWRARIEATSGWSDPLAPEAPPAPAPAGGEARTLKRAPADANLADPFGPGRMVTAWPVPQLGDPSTVTLGAPDLRPPSEACLARLQAGPEAGGLPPDLDCVQRAVRHGYLDRSRTYTAAKWLSPLGNLQLVAHLMAESERRAAHALQAGALVWTVTWLAWVREVPAALDPALAGLTGVERRVLRRRLWRIWGDPAWAPFEPVITRLYEERFTALYPEARGADGLPSAPRLPTGWLWATNWLAAADRLDDAARRQAVAGLDAGGREMLAAALAHPGLAARYGGWPGPAGPGPR